MNRRELAKKGVLGIFGVFLGKKLPERPESDDLTSMDNPVVHWYVHSDGSYDLLSPNGKCVEFRGV